MKQNCIQLSKKYVLFILGATPYQNMTVNQVMKAVKKGYRIEKPAYIKDDL